VQLAAPSGKPFPDGPLRQLQHGGKLRKAVSVGIVQDEHGAELLGKSLQGLANNGTVDDGTGQVARDRWHEPDRLSAQAPPAADVADCVLDQVSGIVPKLFR